MAVYDLRLASLVALLLWLYMISDLLLLWPYSLMAVYDLRLASLVDLLLWLYMISDLLLLWPYSYGCI